MRSEVASLIANGRIGAGAGPRDPLFQETSGTSSSGITTKEGKPVNEDGSNSKTSAKLKAKDRIGAGAGADEITKAKKGKSGDTIATLDGLTKEHQDISDLFHYAFPENIATLADNGALKVDVTLFKGFKYSSARSPLDSIERMIKYTKSVDLKLQEKEGFLTHPNRSHYLCIMKRVSVCSSSRLYTNMCL